jgi:hypothetical protein
VAAIATLNEVLGKHPKNANDISDLPSDSLRTDESNVFDEW